jgi:hypothetical protein
MNRIAKTQELLICPISSSMVAKAGMNICLSPVTTVPKPNITRAMLTAFLIGYSSFGWLFVAP